jgi:hypothetical protein
VCSLAGGFEFIARFPFDRWLRDGEPSQLDAETAQGRVAGKVPAFVELSLTA